MNNNFLKLVLGLVIIGLANLSHADTTFAQISNLNVTHDSNDNVDRATILVTPQPNYSVNSSCCFFGLCMLKTTNLVDPLPKAQISLLLSAKISASPVTIGYHVVSTGQCLIDSTQL